MTPPNYHVFSHFANDLPLWRRDIIYEQPLNKIEELLYVQKNRDFAQNETRVIGSNYISMERVFQEKKKIP